MKYVYHRLREIPGNTAIIRQALAAQKGTFFPVLVTVILFPMFLSLPALIIEGAVAVTEPDAAAILISAAVISGLSNLIISAYAYIGIPHWILRQLDGVKTSRYESLKYGIFAMPRYLLAVIAGVLIVLLKTLLFIIPGIIAVLDYSMTQYVVAEDPAIGPCEALKRSRAIMHGHRWQLFLLTMIFCLPLWLLGAATVLLTLLSYFSLLLLPLMFITGLLIYLVLLPVMYAALAIFYRMIMPEPDSPEFNKLPPVSGAGAFSRELNAVLLVILAIIYIFSGYEKLAKKEKSGQTAVEECRGVPAAAPTTDAPAADTVPTE